MSGPLQEPWAGVTIKRAPLPKPTGSERDDEWHIICAAGAGGALRLARRGKGHRVRAGRCRLDSQGFGHATRTSAMKILRLFFYRLATPGKFEETTFDTGVKSSPVTCWGTRCPVIPETTITSLSRHKRRRNAVLKWRGRRAAGIGIESAANVCVGSVGPVHGPAWPVSGGDFVGAGPQPFLTPGARAASPQVKPRLFLNQVLLIARR